MGGVSSTDQGPGGTSTGKVEQSARVTDSYSFSTDASLEDLEVAHVQKPEVARKSVIVHQPTAPVPISQICAGRRMLLPPSDQPHEGTDNGSTAASVYHPIRTGTESTNNYDVTPISEVTTHIHSTTALSNWRTHPAHQPCQSSPRVPIAIGYNHPNLPMILIPRYSPKLAEFVGFRLHWTIRHYRGVYAVSIMNVIGVVSPFAVNCILPVLHRLGDAYNF